MPVTRLRGSESRSIDTSMRFTVDEHLRIQRAARRAKLSVSDYIRQCIPEASINYWPKLPQSR